MGRAEELFERLSRDKEQSIEAFIGEAVSEELFLDYKISATPPSANHLAPKDLEHFAEAISGFGNIEGGLIVWGVRCKPDPIRGDVPDAKVPIQNPQRFKSWLDGLVSAATVPAHPHVENLVITTMSNASEGFVVTLVGKSDFSPHQVSPVCKHQGHYMMRVGSSFVRMPHAVLAAFFGRSPAPNLQLSLRVRQVNDYEQKRNYEIILGIHNQGRGIALYPSVRIAFSDMTEHRDGLNPSRRHGLPFVVEAYRHSNIPRFFYAGGVNDVVHAGATLEVTRFTAAVALDQGPTHWVNARAVVDYELNCEGFTTSDKVEIVFSNVTDETVFLFP